jgi:hypothetical protein
VPVPVAVAFATPVQTSAIRLILTPSWECEERGAWQPCSTEFAAKLEDTYRLC